MKVLRELRRSPVRLAATVIALALSVAALGVLAVPAVASESLQNLAARDAMSHVTVDVTPMTDPAVLKDIPGVTAAEARHSGTIRTGDGQSITVFGVDHQAQSVDRVRVESGRLPSDIDEVLVSPTAADAGIAVGDELDSPTGALSVVGIGATAAWEVEPIAVVVPESAAAALGQSGPTRVLLRVGDTSESGLERVVENLRSVLGEQGVVFTSFPDTFVGGAHPLEGEIEMISVMIGLLGVVAALVALVLLGSTTAAIITDRSAEIAVFRAIGSGPRATRQHLRGLALGSAGLAAIVGVPLGVLVANLIARMVLEKFAGATPGMVLSVPLALGSAAFLFVGAWLVAAPAARRVAGRSLPDALRGRQGLPYGRGRMHRMVARSGSALHLPDALQMAGRNSVRRPGRSIGLTLQVASGVAAVLVVASLGTSLAAFGEAELEPWRWDTATIALDSGALDRGAGQPASTIADQAAPGAQPSSEETGLILDGSIDGIEVGVFGMMADTRMIDTAVLSGRWIGASGTRQPGDADSGESVEAVLTAGFARHRGIEVGDTVEVQLPSGQRLIEVVGLHRLRSADVFIRRDDLSTLIGATDLSNVVWSTGGPGPLAAALADTVAVAERAVDDLSEEDREGRSVIMGMFWAIGIVVATVAAIGFATSLQMLLFDRRQELATVRAAGGSSRLLSRFVLAEVIPVSALGAAVGAVAAHFGASALMGAVESAESVEIGYSYALSAVPFTVAGAIAMTTVMAMLAVRHLTRKAPAALLRTAT